MGADRSTIKDVAKAAGVSIATVSHVLNNTRFVSEEARTRVEQAIRSVDYTSNTLARALRSSRTNTVGVIVPDIANPFFAALVKAIERVLYQQGYTIVLCHSRDELDRELQQLETLASLQVDGIIIVAASATFDYATLPVYRARPVIFVDRRPGMPAYSGVFCNLRDVLQYATEQLILSGHSRIACILGPSRFSVETDRRQGYLDAMNKHRLTVDPSLVMSGQASQEAGYSRMAYLLDATDVTAVLAANGRIAMGAMHCLRERGIAVPGRMAIIAQGAYEWHQVTTPELTTVLEPLSDIGAAAPNLLLERIKTPRLPERQVVLDAYLTKRSSY